MSEPADARRDGGASERHPRAVLVAVAMLGALGALYAVWPVWRALFPFEIDVNEGWNAYHADAVRAGRSLYPPQNALVVNNYPPLSFYAVAALSRAGFDAVAVGRLLSLAAIPAIAVAVGACVSALGGRRLSAVVAGLWYAATMARFFDAYVGMNDPQLPATALALGALAWFLRRLASGRAAEPAILLVAAAGFYKHTVVATPAAALVQLALHDKRLALRAAAVAGIAVAAGLALCLVFFGRDFFDQLLAPRGHSVAQAFGSLGQLQWVAPAAIIWAVWAWYDRESRAARFTAIYMAASLAAFFLQKLGAGVAANAQFELVAATAIGLGLAFDRAAATPLARRWGLAASRLVILAVVATRLLLANHVEPYLVLASPDYRRLFDENARIVAREVARVRAIPGAVHCSLPTICRRAGKPFVFDYFAMEQRVKTGRMTATALASELAARGIRLEAIDARAGVDWASRRLSPHLR